jgi:hypothetical protein
MLKFFLRVMVVLAVVLPVLKVTGAVTMTWLTALVGWWFVPLVAMWVLIFVTIGSIIVWLRNMFIN